MSNTPQKKQEDLVGLSRKSIVNQLHAIKDSLIQRPPDNNMHGLTEENKLAWLFKNIAHLGNSHYPYQIYAKPSVNNGIFPLVQKEKGPVTIALLADWASCTEESIQIAKLTGEQDYSIHLGDTYYVGNSKEIADNFNDTYGGAWPYGTQGSFALLGNHEMYSSGKSYFTELLPYMGAFCDGKDMLRQEASYFCLENEHWRIIGLDTGYDSLKGFFGLSAKTNLQLPEQQMAWLRDIVQPGKDKRGIIFLSHHQCFSAFEKDEFQAIIPQLAPLLGAGRTVLWFWGHEHRLAFYGYNPLAGDTGCFSRCIGHSGMPVETQLFKVKAPEPTAPSNRNLVMYDQRVRKIIDENISLGHNGYVVLHLDGPGLIASYYDDSFVDSRGLRAAIAEEEWSIDTVSGKLTGINIVDRTAGAPSPASGNLSHFQPDIRLAISRDGQ